jgi:orotidine-5'-phosphate decarboxylase
VGQLHSRSLDYTRQSRKIDGPQGRWYAETSAMTFFQRLEERSRQLATLLCVGLDPDPALMPEMDVAAFNRAIIEATHDLVCAYKLNLAFYEALGPDFTTALGETLAASKKHGVPAIADGKRGDIENTSRFYAKALFERWGFDAATVNPYMGHDAVKPFLDYGDRGIYLLCRTSNPGAEDFQPLSVTTGSHSYPRPLYETVALKAQEWNTNGNVGLVVGATRVEDLSRVRRLCPGLPFLVPGVGPQGGDMEQAVRAGVGAQGGRIIINASRQVLYASRSTEFPQRAREAAQQLRDRLHAALRSSEG